jgi:hypothetical protein
MVIKVKLTHSQKIWYINKTVMDAEEQQYYLQFFFEDIGQRMGWRYKAGDFEILGRSTLEQCKQ